jgi:hypothetical protein
MTLPSTFEDQASPSLFEGINAKYYKSSEVARSFVPNEQFENVAIRQHSILVGPRGSGKTTLLRMLHPDSLRAWDHPAAASFRQKVDFSAVYVATDRVWRQQTDGAAHRLSPEERGEFVADIIALDVMAAMLRTMELRLNKGNGPSGEYRWVELGDSAVNKLVAEIADGWRVKPKFLDIGSLRVSIRRRRIEARDWAARPGALDRVGLGIRWDDAALLAIDAFESVTGRTGELWALLFDELEIVPSSVRDGILESTRGMDGRLILKCSLSPWLPEHALAVDQHAGTVFNDFNVIKLFYGRRAESYAFSRNLIKGRLTAAGMNSPDGIPVENAVFGYSQFAGDESNKPKRTAAAYGDAAPLGQMVKELANHDPKFLAWLREKDIDPEHLDRVHQKERAETLRKARNIMIARLEFRKTSGFLRSRKTMAMYTGGSTMLDICEGNPRLLLGLLSPLLDFYDGKHPVPRHLQAEALSKIADDFYALIDAIPIGHETLLIPEFGGRAVRSPYREFIKRVSSFFQTQILGGDFDPQPPSTFRIPKSASQPLQDIVGRLINLGAIVVVPDRGIKDLIIGDFDQHRLRLCYLIAAREHLPPNVDRPISVLRILGAENNPGLPGLEEETP